MSDMEKARWQSDLTLIADAAKEAGAVAFGFFNQSPEVWWKNEDRSPVSAADFAANKTLETILRKARPDYGWLSEETDDDADRLSRETLFIVDPIDGTRAFLGGQKVWCVSVAVVHRGRPVAGVLYAPALEELYEAVEGGVALKNGVPFTVSAAGAEEMSRLAIGDDLLKTFPSAFRDRVTREKYIPSLAYRIAMVADGRLEGTFVKGNSHDWDLAAADLILVCAGGGLVDIEGQPIVYNRAEVTHKVLCAAPTRRLGEFLAAFAERRDS
ncbi:3'(2'),5'-bisphosphate nucleotidase CysQ [Rhizobium leguminosarum]|jgi:myo-inositol-1(or 4)-monophosphatase|uniref:3'(2'),5'-bisphosphate nucleotidase CysQ n=1 Tax=Rhizobium leguminosarum TaxID=384 RepID=UPI000DE53D20|nr:3'(2'),5'-bisphosphate nucleotidase CysQ [Rhizobium leguminosarum]MDI5923965.1 3'(2'),5'-bisphosphate nucleotidase CysQ [Rhizobium leguminosarum]QIO72654.1 3'(2'),5'-bisphosphate nucleotidase CysQ [Rhizobium leguminosarum bv. trifolii]QIO79673.1 3'(2'),5'-bisphosphate nucleotidase CysQ [Rhizobium leguminosarum bv. trifolii]TBZ43204.1 3'(2'),5'-bisphosphate nucleotidase CysQ [Rhizobium leguminosarum bv. viciae]TCA43630.1 3'(2'),5'-bisphosphate nucleotidase CysQ [Rhizobium leguminosarum bv. v